MKAPYFNLFLYLTLIFATIQGHLVRVPLMKSPKTEMDKQNNFLNLNSNNASMRIKNFMNSQYIGTIKVGSDEKEFKVVLDTGSANLWIPDASISDESANSYDCSSSSTCQAFPNSIYPLSYGTGDIVGYKVIDQIQLGELNISQFNLLLAYDVQDIPKGTFDGILGLSLGRYLQEFPTVLEILKESGHINEGTFSMYLGDDPNSYGGNTGEIIFGGYDPKYATSEFQFVEIFHPSKTLFWAANMEAISYGSDQNMTGIANIPVVFDSGTSLLLMPDAFLDNLVEQASSKGITFTVDSTSGLYVCSCKAQNMLEEIKFFFEGATLVIPATSYIINQYGRCYLGIQGRSGRISLSNPVILGDVLLKNYYLLYTADNSTIGFAQAVPVPRFPIWILFVILLGALLIIALGSYIWNRIKQKKSDRNFGSNGIVIGGSYNELSSRFIISENRAGNYVRESDEVANYPLPINK